MRGALLMNLGSPESASVGDVRRYLREFLMDGRVLDAPWPIRKMIVEGFILPFRPRKSAEAYRAIWMDEGSPLIVISRRQQARLQEKLPNTPVALAMRYGNSSCEEGLKELIRRGVDEILLFPMYPHYAMSSYETAVVAALDTLRKTGSRAKASILRPFYKEPRYIDALVESARDYLNWDNDYLLFSFHGIPERHVKKSDPTGAHCLQSKNCCGASSPAHATCYRHQVFETARLFAEKANIPPDRHSVSFQSRLGRDPWLQPFTDFELPRLAREGIRKLLIICPAFVTDCLETLEEIGIRGRRAFLEAGGEELRLIPCMNDNPRWIETMGDYCRAAGDSALWQSAGHFLSAARGRE